MHPQYAAHFQDHPVPIGRLPLNPTLPHMVDRRVPAARHRSDNCSNQRAYPGGNADDRWLEIPKIPAALVCNMFSDPRAHTRAGASAQDCPYPSVPPALARMQSNPRDHGPRYRDVLLFPVQADGLIVKANEGSLERSAVACFDFNLLADHKLM